MLLRDSASKSQSLPGSKENDTGLITVFHFISSLPRRFGKNHPAC